MKNFFHLNGLFSKYRKEPYSLFRKLLGFYPRDINYYLLALTHRSLSMTNHDGKVVSNERLEFLGDAVLNAIVSDLFYRHYEQKDEGFLTNIRSKIVNRDSLNHLALKLELDKIVKVSKNVNPQVSNDIYGNALEALIGAIYLDYGYNHCMKFVKTKLFEPFIDLSKVEKFEMNYKSKLIEWCQKNHFQIDFEMSCKTHNENHQPIFLSRVLIEGRPVSESTGLNKKESQQKASRIAYQQIIEQKTFHFINEESKN